MAICYFCCEPTDDDNLVDVYGGIVRVCDNCRETQDIGEPQTEPIEEEEEDKNENNEH